MLMRRSAWLVAVFAGLALAGTALFVRGESPTVEPSASAAAMPGPAPTTQVDVAAADRSAARTAYDGARAWEHLRQLVAIGPRPAGSPGIRQARAYIGRQVSEMGLTLQEQLFTADTPAGRVQMSNLVVRLPGRRTDRILFAGHYDTKLLKNQVFVGASDGGSSAAFLLELVRTLAAAPSREFTYEFVWLDGEEAFCLDWYECGSPDAPDHTYGSRYYVQAAQKANALASIKAMILVDMIADRDLMFLREAKSTSWLKDIIWGTARTMAFDHIFVDREQSVEDDHVPFLEAGVPAVDIIDLDYPYWHTPDDTLEHVSARGLQIVGDVLVTALPRIEDHLR